MYGNGIEAPARAYPATQGALSLFGDVNQQITGAMARVIGTTDGVRQLANNLFGIQPEPASNSGAATVGRATPNTAADETRNNLLALHDAITTLEQQVARLATVA